MTAPIRLIARRRRVPLRKNYGFRELLSFRFHDDRKISSGSLVLSSYILYCAAYALHCSTGGIHAPFRGPSGTASIVCFLCGSNLRTDAPLRLRRFDAQQGFTAFEELIHFAKNQPFMFASSRKHSASICNFSLSDPFGRESARSRSASANSSHLSTVKSSFFISVLRQIGLFDFQPI